MGVTTNGHGVSFRGDKNVPKFTVVMVAQLCEYTKSHSTVSFCMVCELYDMRALYVNYFSTKLLSKLATVLLPL